MDLLLHHGKPYLGEEMQHAAAERICNLIYVHPIGYRRPKLVQIAVTVLPGRVRAISWSACCRTYSMGLWPFGGKKHESEPDKAAPTCVAFALGRCIRMTTPRFSVP